MTWKRAVGIGLMPIVLLGSVGVAPSAGQFGAGDYSDTDSAASTTPPNQIPACTVRLIREALVPAMVPGAIASIDVTEGAMVSKDQPLAQLDAQEAEMDVKLANNELDVAQKQAENDVDKRVAEAAYGAAYKELQSAIEVNKRTQAAISDVEIAKLKFEAIRANLAIEQAERDFEIAKVTVIARKTQVKAAELTVHRHKILAPISGYIEDINMHEGEWVNPGDTILHIVQLDQLKVQGFVNSHDLHPSEVFGRPVTVEVELPRGRRVPFKGRIDFVSTDVRSTGDYLVWATVDNSQENGRWVLYPGMTASMTIDVGTLKAAERATPSGTR